jgi:hypothetical protein
MHEFTADEIAPLLRITRTAAHTRLKLAVQLTTRLPGTLAALDQGDIDLYKARILTELTTVLDDQQATTVETHPAPRRRPNPWTTPSRGPTRGAAHRPRWCRAPPPTPCP